MQPSYTVAPYSLRRINRAKMRVGAGEKERQTARGKVVSFKTLLVSVVCRLGHVRLKCSGWLLILSVVTFENQLY